jgi:hypothetical protein
MSGDPREELRSLAGQDMPVAMYEVDEALERFERWYAHELAEKQRYHTDLIAATQGHAELAIVMRVQKALSDLIDPEVLNSGT